MLLKTYSPLLYTLSKGKQERHRSNSRGLKFQSFCCHPVHLPLCTNMGRANHIFLATQSLSNQEVAERDSKHTIDSMRTTSMLWWLGLSIQAVGRVGHQRVAVTVINSGTPTQGIGFYEEHRRAREGTSWNQAKGYLLDWINGLMDSWRY